MRAWEVILDRARTKWPGTPGTVIVSVDTISPWLERPVAFRCGIFIETFLVTAYYPSLSAEFSHVAEARYVGLRRSCPLMSERERRLDPKRLPA
jgi:hypothetical protein